MGKSKTLFFSEIFAAYDLKVGKIFKIFFYRINRAMTLKLGIHVALDHHQVYTNGDLLLGTVSYGKMLEHMTSWKV